MKKEMRNYIGILQGRRKCFTVEEIKGAETMEIMRREARRIQEFSDRIVNGEPEAVRQIKDMTEV